MKIRSILSFLAAGALVAVSSETAQAASNFGAYSINFDNISSGADANTAVPSGLELEFHYGFYDFKTLGDGSTSDTKVWQVDDSGTNYSPSRPVADNPSTVYGGLYGAAPSLSNALNAIEGPILLTLTNPVDLQSFSVTLDNASAGNLGDSPILFFDLSDNQIASVSSFQSSAGYVSSTSNLVSGVSYILLPTGAFYDNLSLLAVPEPAYGPVALVLVGLLAFSSLRTRKTPL